MSHYYKSDNFLLGSFFILNRYASSAIQTLYNNVFSKILDHLELLRPTSWANWTASQTLHQIVTTAVDCYQILIRF